MKIISTTAYAESLFYPEIKLIRINWLQPPRTDADYEIPFRDCIEFSTKNIAYFFLSDIRNQGSISPERRKWFQEYALKEAIKNGLKKSAALFEGGAFKKYYLNKISKLLTTLDIPFRFFNNEEEALAWLTKDYKSDVSPEALSPET